MELGSEIAAAEKPCQRGAICDKTESSVCQELPKTPYAPENSHIFTFCEPSPRVSLKNGGWHMQLLLLCFWISV